MSTVSEEGVNASSFVLASGSGWKTENGYSEPVDRQFVLLHSVGPVVCRPGPVDEKTRSRAGTP